MTTELSTQTKEETKENLLKWNRILVTFDGGLGVVASIALSNLEGSVHKKVEEALKLLYENVRAANNQFIQAIKNVDEGKPYSPIVEPDDLPEFPDDPTSAKTTAEMIWKTTLPVLKVGLSRLPSDSPWVKVLYGVIETGDDTIATITKLLE